MADFIRDSQVARRDAAGVWTAELSPEWAVWGPNGGYLASIAFRAIMGESALPRPASFHCHFLAVGEFAPVEIRIERVGGGKRAESFRAEVRQGDRMLLVAGAWVVGEGLKGFEHDFATAPEVPGPAELRSYRELAGDEYVEWYPIWRSIEGRPLQWDAPPGPPVSRTWMRFTDTAVADTVGDAVRQLFWMDYPGWNATIAAHPWPARFLAPNLDLSIQFHRFAPEEEWTLVDGYAPVAADGLIGCNARLWTPDGRLLATGTSTHTCRPNPQYAQELEQARARGAGE